MTKKKEVVNDVLEDSLSPEVSEGTMEQVSIDLPSALRDVPHRLCAILKARDQMDINLLQSLVNFVDVVAQRGMIKGDELSVVGSLRENLVMRVKELESHVYTNDDVAPDVIIPEDNE